MWVTWRSRIKENIFLIKDKIINFFKTGNDRSIKVKKNIFFSFFLKGVNVLVGFIIVPLTLGYLNTEKYGLWLTISSVIGWLGFFDIGLGHGLRNRLTEAIALNDFELAKKYISTTYAILIIIIGIVFIIFFAINPFLNWSILLNASPEISEELSKVVLWAFTFFVFRFVFQIIGIIYIANQLPAINDALSVCGQILALVVIFVITKFSHGNLLYICFAYSIAPLIILIIATIYSFSKKFSKFKPSFKCIDFKYFNLLANLGIKFFILQIAGIIIFSSSNIIITQILGPKEVTSYNIAYKYFSMPIMIFSIIMTPFWSAFTDAITKNDYIWIKSIMKKLIYIWAFMSICVIIMIIAANIFYKLWVGNEIIISFRLTLIMGVFAIISMWNNIYAFLINGAGKIKLQMYYSIISMIINIPISIYFAKNMNLGSSGVILGTCCSLLLGFILAPVQSYKLINKTATGIWNQ